MGPRADQPQKSGFTLLIRVEELAFLLAGSGLVDPDADLDAELTEEVLCTILADGIGLGISTDTPDVVVVRGDLADLLKTVYEAVNAQ